MSYNRYVKNYRQLKQELLSNPSIRKQYDQLEPKLALVEQIIEKRNALGYTQKEFAQKIGTKQSAISRFESGAYNPSIAFLQKLSNALGSSLTITINPE